MNRISGPLLDRIDLQCEVVPVPFSDLSKAPAGESSKDIRQRVIKARQIQSERFKNIRGVHCNAQMSSRMLHTFAEPDAEGLAILNAAMERLDLSARAYEKILKVARTIADLDGSEHIKRTHIAEAVGYRNLDRASWGE